MGKVLQWVYLGNLDALSPAAGRLLWGAICVKIMFLALFIITPCACAAGGRVIGLCLSVCPLVPYSCSNEGLVETLLHNTIVRIQKSLAST